MKSNLQHSTERRQKNLWNLLTGKCIPCETLRLLSKFRACVYQFIKLLPTILSCLVGSILRLLMAFSSKAQNNLIVFSGFLSTIFPSRVLLFWFTFIPQGKEAGRPNEASLKAITKELRNHEKQLISLPYRFTFSHDSVLIMFSFEVYLWTFQDIKECDKTAWTGKPSSWSHGPPQVSFCHVTHLVAWYRIAWSFTTD